MIQSWRAYAYLYVIINNWYAETLENTVGKSFTLRPEKYATFYDSENFS